MFHDETNEVLTKVHDRELLSTSQGRFFEAIPAKTSFVVGLIYGVLSLCTIGFLVLFVVAF